EPALAAPRSCELEAERVPQQEIAAASRAERHAVQIDGRLVDERVAELFGEWQIDAREEVRDHALRARRVVGDAAVGERSRGAGGEARSGWGVGIDARSRTAVARGACGGLGARSVPISSGGLGARSVPICNCLADTRVEAHVAALAGRRGAASLLLFARV